MFVCSIIFNESSNVRENTCWQCF